MAKAFEYGLVGVIVIFLLVERWIFSGKILEALTGLVSAVANLRNAHDIEQKIDGLADDISQRIHTFVPTPEEVGFLLEIRKKKEAASK